ncbi:MAG: septation protein IspZ [Sphingomonas sp.]
MTEQAGARHKTAQSGIALACDVGPIAVFFVFNFVTPGLQITRLLTATVAFMVASVAAMAVSRWKLGKISPMLWFSSALVLVFGALTLYFHNEEFIKLKPTVIYASLAAILGYGWFAKRPLLQQLFGSTYEGVSPRGWDLLTRNWAFYLAFMALLNEVVRHSFSTDFWVSFKLWGAIPLTMLFSIANVPMLMRHGLGTDKLPPIPPEG